MSNVIANVQAARKNDATFRNEKLLDILLDIYTQIGRERIFTLWANRGIQSEIPCSEPERQLVKRLWDAIPSGSSCWMDAFYMLLQTAKANLPKGEIVVGSPVCYSSSFLRSIGVHTGPMAGARGWVTEIAPLGETKLARIEWERDCRSEVPERVNVKNLSPFPEGFAK